VVGVNDHPVWLRSSQDTAFNYIKDSGARSVRIDVPWDLIEPSRGSYDSLRLGLIDAFVNRAATGGLDVLMIATNAPQWANGSTDPHVAPLNNNDYADYLQFLITRYSGKVSAFEIWNEPNGGWAWTNPDPVKYANLLKAAYTRAKSIDPSVIILAPSLSGPDQASYLDKFYAQGTKNYFDAFSMHGYWWNLNGSTVLPYWNATNKDQSIFGAFTTRIMPVMTKYGDQAKPVWWTESGISTQGQQTTETDQANKIDEAYTAFRNRVVPTMTHLYWYDITDSVGTGSEQNFGLVNLAGTSATVPSPSDFVAKPAYSRFQAQAKLL
jgi:hypothetical protein